MEATGSARPARAARPLRLLSLDGGGIRGLSELFILDAIMYGIRRAANLDSDPLPADYFDLICGTSTGGLIAILLGRLRMSVPDAIKQYGELSEYVFSEQKRGGIGLFTTKNGKFKATKLEEAIRKVLVEKLGETRDDELMLEADRATGCKTFVCAVPAHNVSTPRLFRSYQSTMPSYSAKIWEVARATSAAPTFFKPIRIGEKGMEEVFIDGGVGNNNPVKLAIQEAMDEFPTDSRVACIVSIGTGRPTPIGLPNASGLRQNLPLGLIRVLKEIATDCQKVADELSEKYLDCCGLYHRLNVEFGLADIALGEWGRLNEVKTHTTAYLEKPEMRRKTKEIVDILLERDDTAYPLSKLGR
ncbi:FabD/lysophospholipase-like protein [Cadophora sp. DSE1049]|nr:FabD/lysophospholipase-like protein [Cadophora sp. DSE1049]